MHRAGPALGNAAAVTRAGQPDRVAQHPEQRGVGFHIHVIRSSIDGETGHSFLPTGGSPKAGDKETTPNNQGSGPPAPTPWPKNGGRLWRDAEVDQSRPPHCNMRHRGTASSLEPELNRQETPFRYV